MYRKNCYEQSKKNAHFDNIEILILYIIEHNLRTILNILNFLFKYFISNF